MDPIIISPDQPTIKALTRAQEIAHQMMHTQRAYRKQRKQKPKKQTNELTTVEQILKTIPRKKKTNTPPN